MLDKIKINNIKRIMLCILARQCATKAEIISDTGLSTSTVSSCVNSLMQLKLLTDEGMEESSGGRRATIYRMRSDYGCFAGLDLREDRIGLVVTDCETKVLVHKMYPLVKGNSPLNTITAILDEVIAQNKNVLGIGIGLSAKMDCQEKIVISAPDFGWEYVHLKEIIERRYMIFTYVDHRANGKAIYEGMIGHARGEDNYLYVGEASGGKAVLVLDGKLCRGADNITGSFQDGCIKDFVQPSVLNFMGVSQLLIGYRTEMFRDSLIESAKGFGGEIRSFEQDESAYSVGMAAITQRKWFESIYFML